MKKRLRKKTHRGEFQELGFRLKLNYDAFAGYDDEAFFDFIDEIADGLESRGFEVGGNFDLAESVLAINLGPAAGAEERRKEAVEFVRSVKGVTGAEPGELVDAWYGDLDV